jgi:hypothetical protein
VAGLLFERRRLWEDEDPDGIDRAALFDATLDAPAVEQPPQPKKTPSLASPQVRSRSRSKPRSGARSGPRSTARSTVVGSKLRETDAGPIEGATDDRRSIGSRATQGDRAESADARLADARLVDSRLADAIAVDGLEGNLSAPVGQPDAEDQTVIQSGRIALGERP